MGTFSHRQQHTRLHYGHWPRSHRVRRSCSAHLVDHGERFWRMCLAATLLMHRMPKIPIILSGVSCCGLFPYHDIIILPIPSVEYGLDHCSYR